MPALATDAHPAEPERAAPVAPEYGKRPERVALIGLILLYLASAYGFAVVTPYGEAPDEYAHLLYIEHIVNYGRVPDIAPNPYTYESFQPPLYYIAGAFVVAAGRTLTGNNMSAPLAPPVSVRPEGRPGIDLAVLFHPPEDRWPLTVYVLRGYSMLLGLGLVLLTYATARLIVPWPAPATVPLLSTAFAALIPQANFIRASVSSENLADLMGALIVWLLVLYLMRPQSEMRVFWVGVALGLALLTKTSLIPMTVPVIWVMWVRSEGVRRFLRDLAILLVGVALMAGWFFIYRWIEYGDPLGYAATRAMITPDGQFSLWQLFWFEEPFRSMLWKSFWGVFGWQQVFMPEWFYASFAVAAILAVAGGVYLLVRGALARSQQLSVAVVLITLLLVYAFIVQASTVWVAWQGREMYPALSSVCLLLGLGLGGLVLGRGAVQSIPVKRWRFLLSQGVVAVVCFGLLALNIYSIVGVTLPALNP